MGRINLGPCACCGGSSSSDSSSSSSGEFSYDCCCGQGGETLTATISAVANCDCADDVTVTLTPTEVCDAIEATLSTWVGSADFCNTRINLELLCGANVDAKDWEISVTFDNACASLIKTADEDSTCNPLMACFSNLVISICCDTPQELPPPPPDEISICITL